jgi:formylglycine-generating enzyme required for sulfatase activity
MKKTMISVCALLLVGVASMMTAGAQGSGKPTLAVFVVGMDNTLGDALATQIGSDLTSGGRYTLTSVNITGKRDELRVAYASGGGISINQNALAAWGRDNGISAICLVMDDVKGNDNLFSAKLIDTKEAKLEGKGNYVRRSVGSSELSRVALMLAKQLEGSGRRHSTSAPARSYPAELDIEMVFVEGGTFQMGCQDDACRTNELPVHSVTLSSFSMGKYEVTRAQWLAVMADHPTLANPGTWKDEDQAPIESVSYDDITGVDGFLERLNGLTGKNYRLPTEAEWEYAARGGKHQSPYKYSGSDNFDEVSHYVIGRSQPVGGKKPNALGIYDMSGNVMEWCSDWYNATYYTTIQNGATNPTWSDYGTYRVCRGGRFTGDINFHRVAYRLYSSTYTLPTLRTAHVGFRVVLPAQ